MELKDLFDKHEIPTWYEFFVNHQFTTIDLLGEAWLNHPEDIGKLFMTMRLTKDANMKLHAVYEEAKEIYVNSTPTNN